MARVRVRRALSAERRLQEAWAAQTREQLERAYLEAQTGPGGAGCSYGEDGWATARHPLLNGFASSGPWLDVGCANGYLLQTLPEWAREYGLNVEPHGLELIPTVAELARAGLPHLRNRIWTGDVMRWEPPKRFTTVTTMDDPVPPELFGALIKRLLEGFVVRGGRVIVSSYASSAADRAPCVDVAKALSSLGFVVLGEAEAAMSGRVVTRIAWMEAPR